MTGTGRRRLTHIDHFIIEFIGQKSAIVIGLDIPESGAEQNAEEDYFNREYDCVIGTDNGGYIAVLQHAVLLHEQ